MMAADLLDIETIAFELPEYQVQYFDQIDSTNSYLMSREAGASSMLALAEAQTGGRGRRSKTWLSPHARSLSISLGVATNRNLNELGGLSSVVGIALYEVLQSMGATRTQLKWPNDVLVEGAKLCGILVELQRIKAQSVAVIGVGVNVDLTEAEITEIEQEVTDLRRQGVSLDRTRLVVQIVRALGQQIAIFERDGFGAFVERFDQAHCYQGQTCEILSGASSFTGVVQGIEVDGALRIDNGSEVISFHGGEVSLRAKH